jgi:hypothetical protein
MKSKFPHRALEMPENLWNETDFYVQSKMHSSVRVVQHGCASTGIKCNSAALQRVDFFMAKGVRWL